MPSGTPAEAGSVCERAPNLTGSPPYGETVPAECTGTLGCAFATGELVRAVVPRGLKSTGRHVGRVLVRASGSFDVATLTGRVQGVNSR